MIDRIYIKIVLTDNNKDILDRHSFRMKKWIRIVVLDSLPLSDFKLK